MSRAVRDLTKDIPPSPSLETIISEALKGLRYGSVEIVVHDAKVVQIERKEKFRPSEAGFRLEERNNKGS